MICTSNLQKETVTSDDVSNTTTNTKINEEPANTTEEVDTKNELKEEENLYAEDDEENNTAENEVEYIDTHVKEELKLTYVIPMVDLTNSDTDSENEEKSEPIIAPQDCLVIDICEDDENVESDDNEDGKTVDEESKKKDVSKTTKRKQTLKSRHEPITFFEEPKLPKKIARNQVMFIKQIVLLEKVPNIEKIEYIKKLITHWINGTSDSETKNQIRIKYFTPFYQTCKEKTPKNSKSKIKNKLHCSNSRENIENNQVKTSTDTKENEEKNKVETPHTQNNKKNTKPKITNANQKNKTEIKTPKRKVVNKLSTTSGEPSIKRSKSGRSYQFDKKLQPRVQPLRSNNTIVKRLQYKRNVPEYRRKLNNKTMSPYYNPQRFCRYDTRNQNLINRRQQNPSPWMNTVTNNMSGVIAEALQKAQVNLLEQRIAYTVANALRQSLSIPNLFNPTFIQPQPAPLLQQNINKPSTSNNESQTLPWSSNNKTDRRDDWRRCAESNISERISPWLSNNCLNLGQNEERKYDSDDKYDYSRNKESNIQGRKEYHLPEPNTRNYYSEPTTSTNINTQMRLSNQSSLGNAYQTSQSKDSHRQSSSFDQVISTLSFDEPYQCLSTFKSNFLDKNVEWKNNYKECFDKAVADEFARHAQNFRYNNCNN